MTKRFPGLDGIRAIAACGVMVSHTLKELYRFDGHERHQGLQLASQGVIMFFTLSGFLITYLLLRERDERGSLDLGAFYLRRILRIWPLYFFYVAVAVAYHALAGVGVPHPAYLVLFVLFLPNLAYNLGRHPPDTAPLWSIGIEEQFYAVWPLVLSRVRRLEPLLLAVIIGLPAARAILHVVQDGESHLATAIVDSLGYDAMAIGALFAIWYRRGDASLLRWAQSPLVHVAFGGLVVLLAANLLSFDSIALPLATSVITALFIVAQIAGDKKLIDLEQPGLRYLGKISFGIYVYHMLVITLVARALVGHEVPAPVVVAVIAVATIGIASVSYRVLETPFLRLKQRFER